jgi:hypothetical protein
VRTKNKKQTHNVEMRVHRRRALLATREGQANVRAVSHAVGRKDAKDGIDDLRSGVHVLESQGLGRSEQSIQVTVKV